MRRGGINWDRTHRNAKVTRDPPPNPQYVEFMDRWRADYYTELQRRRQLRKKKAEAAEKRKALLREAAKRRGLLKERP